MEVFKFGGASVKDANGVKNIAEIIKRYPDSKKVVVVSAMGKSTNALEDVINNYIAKNEVYLQYLREIREYHISVAYDLLSSPKKLEFQLFALFDMIEQFCEQNTSTDYAFIYDQIVSVGELASTKIVAAYFTEIGLESTWLDARELILTNDAYTDAKVEWETTTKRVKDRIEKGSSNLYIIQGFIGGNADKLTTTLGREGSDFTASILSFCLNASNMTIWKDVPGVLNADPKLFSDAQLLEKISYKEAIEMTYYGAKVIHPKTIRPLQNKQIPLLVKSFLNQDSKGTTIHSFEEDLTYPPIIVKKYKQILLSFLSRDFSFIAEDSLAEIFKAFDQYKLRMNMMHTGAIRFSVSVDNDKPEKIKAVKLALKDTFAIEQNAALELLTIRHYNQEIVDRELHGLEVLLEQKTRNNVQYLYRKAKA